MEFGTDTFCGHNALGGAIGSNAQSTLQTALTNSVNTGGTNVMFEFLQLTNLSGTNQAELQLGALSGTPVAAAANQTYSGASDLDWWYTTAASSIDSSRTPLSKLAASINAKALTASGTLNLSIALGGTTPSNLHMSGANVKATIGSANAPSMSSNGLTPGHLATENLDPTLTSFSTMSNGALCGNISAASLATVPVPSALLPGGAGSCNENYTANNSLLDVLVSGCTHTVFIVTVTLVSKTPPDQFDPGVPPAGAGALYKLSASNGTTHVVDTCKDMSGATVNLAACLTAAAYSSYLDFTSDRVIAK